MNELRDITVVLGESEQSDIRLDVAIALARRHNAHLTGLSALGLLAPGRPFVQRRDGPALGAQPAPQMMAWGMAPSYLEVDTRAAEAAGRVEAAFREQLQFSGLQGSWRMAGGDVSDAVVGQARQADLAILGQIDPGDPPPLGRHLIEAALMTSGRPVLVVPYAGRYKAVGARVLVAWNNSREAARAVSDALPLLAQAASVTVLEVSATGRRPADGGATGADIARHLARHGVNAEAHAVAGSISVPDALLNYAADLSADLLVVGGYGHSRLRELILGGITRELLQHMTLPVLMSH
jgi:nucleotide-binding universal stress UspA family protein